MLDLSDIRRLIDQAARRLATERFLRALHVSGLVAAGLAVLLALVDRAGAAPFVPWLWTAAALAVIAVAAAWIRQRTRRPDELTVAVMVDERLGLRERLSNALQASGEAGGIARVVVEDGIAAARDPRVREAIGRRFTVQGPRRGWLTPALAIIAAGVLQLPQADLFASDPLDEDQADAAMQARHEAEATVEAVAAALEQSPELAEQMADLAEELAMPEELAGELDDPEEIRREAIKRLTRTTQRLEELLEGEEASAMKSLEDMFAGLRPMDGPASDLAAAMREGDFTKAKEALEEMMEQLADGEMDPDAAKELGDQLQQLADQMQQLAEQQDQMERALAEAGLDPQLANNPQAMQQAIQQSQALNEQQKQQLQQRMQAMQQAQQMAKQMAGACQNLGQAMQGMPSGGQNGQAQGAGQQMADQLSDLETMQQMLSQASSMLGQCKGGGQGMGQGMMAGMGMGQQGGQRGGGANANPVSAAPGQTVQQREDVAMREGEVIARMLIDGEPIPGESKAALRDVVRAAATGFDESIEEAPLPRRYHESVKHYFGRLQKQIEAVQVKEAPPTPPTGPEGGSTGGQD